MYSHPPNPRPRVTLLSVSDVEVTESGKPYFRALFRQGVLGKPVSRTFWADLDDEDAPTWKRISPENLRLCEGRDLTGEVEVVAVPIQPEEFEGDDGRIHVVTSRAVVRFADESVEQATRRSGSLLREETPPAQHHPAPAPVRALAIHGDGYPGGGGIPEVPA